MVSYSDVGIDLMDMEKTTSWQTITIKGAAAGFIKNQN